MKSISAFLKIQNQLRIFHWQTPSYAQHKAFGKAYEAFDGLVDNYIEVFIGKYGKTQGKITYKLELESYDEAYDSFIDNCIVFLNGLSNELDSTDTDLLNIRDEMLGELNRLKYLLTLN